MGYTETNTGEDADRNISSQDSSRDSKFQRHMWNIVSRVFQDFEEGNELERLPRRTRRDREREED